MHFQLGHVHTSLHNNAPPCITSWCGHDLTLDTQLWCWVWAVIQHCTSEPTAASLAIFLQNLLHHMWSKVSWSFKFNPPPHWSATLWQSSKLLKKQFILPLLTSGICCFLLFLTCLTLTFGQLLFLQVQMPFANHKMLSSPEHLTYKFILGQQYLNCSVNAV